MRFVSRISYFVFRILYFILCISYLVFRISYELTKKGSLEKLQTPFLYYILDTRY